MPGLSEGALLGLAWRAAASAAAPGLRLMLHRRIRRGKEIAARLPERFGIDPTPRPPGPLLWLHAASVGETVSLLPVLDALRGGPATVLVTTGTVTSAALLQRRAPATLHRFVPLDVPAWAARFLDHWRPDAAAFVESELWPNIIAACRARGVRLMLLNARLSARSQAGWGRAPAFARRVLGAFEVVWAQSDADAGRLTALGARCVCSPGNLKFAAPPLPADPVELARLRPLLTGPAWLAASTHPGEEEMAAAIHRRLLPSHPGLVTAIAPRHPDRGPVLAAAIGARRRGAGQDPAPGMLWVADGLGEMGLLYRLFPLVFVGKSLVAPGGGQNPLEPARLGCAIAAGPAMQNQADAARVLGEAGALCTVPDAASLEDWVGAMLRDPAARARAAGAARQSAGTDPAMPARAAAALLAMAVPA